ncbi:hypothetical protein [Gordonia sp. OPL2]|uniref:hypothetical protein n=1 Tax=Gordonia sp. OPL2 TaxID=2486274 RepID=UPI00165575D9|nr:hypothetical protein [Gordonia sp. OPL2]ROZ88980.1 hypothetical protein EEB19_19920 [Gordonia sp. OPL2]
MNGPDHYREAERLVDLAVDGMAEVALAGIPGVTTQQLAEAFQTHDTVIRCAQVHATLALAAATTLQHLRSPDTATAWREIALGEPTTEGDKQ